MVIRHSVEELLAKNPKQKPKNIKAGMPENKVNFITL